MTGSVSRRLRGLYEGAVYEADLPGGNVVFRVGRAPEGRPPGGTLAIVTAWNPGSEQRPRDVNDAANLRLASELKRRGFVHFPALGRDEAGGFRESSFAVPSIAAREAQDLARLFRQAAVFYWDGEHAEILFCG